MRFVVRANLDVGYDTPELEEKYFDPFPVELNSLEEIITFSNEMRLKFGQEVLIDFNAKNIWIGDQTW